MKRTIAVLVLPFVLVCLYMFVSREEQPAPPPAASDSGAVREASAAIANESASGTSSKGRIAPARSLDATNAVSSRPQEEAVQPPASASTTSGAPALNALSARMTAAPERTADSAQAAPAADEVPLHWGVTGSNTEGYKLRTDRAVVMSGSASGVLESYADTDTSRFGALIQVASAAAFKGKRIELSAYIATLDALAGAAVWMRADDANGTMVAFENTAPRGIRGTQEWTYQNIVMDIPKEAVALVYGAVLNGRGKLYVDDLQFRVVDENVAVTAKPITPQRSVARGTIADPGREPRNLDFEETRMDQKR